MSTIALAALVALTPLTTEASVLRSPYKGGVAPYTFTFASSCAKAVTVVAANFSFSKGTGGLGLDFSHAKVCGQLGNIGPVNAFAYGYAESGLLLSIKVHVPTGSHTVSPTLGARWNVTDAYSLPNNCSAPRPVNFSSSYAPPNASYAYWDNATGYRSVCVANAEVTSWFNSVQLVDLTNLTTILPSYGCPSSGWSCGTTLFDYDNSYSLDTGWAFYNDTTYSAGNWSYSTGVISLNYTSKLVSPTITSGTAVDSFGFNYTYNRSHVYALQFDVGAFADVGMIGWPGGSATARTNLETLGNGFVLRGIAIT